MAAPTYYPQLGIDFIRELVKGMPLAAGNETADAVGARIVQDVSDMMWMAAPWRWTVGALPAVTLVANTVDYTVTWPSDFLYLQDAFMTNGDKITQLVVTSALPADAVVNGLPQFATVTESAAGVFDKLRVLPKLGASLPQTWQVIGMYKKIAPTIQRRDWNTAGVLKFPDVWAHVFHAGLQWGAYKYGDDQRAGQVTYKDGSTTSNGLYANFMAGLQEMRQAENLTVRLYRSDKDTPDERKRG
jgi:hypothetical protein